MNNFCFYPEGLLEDREKYFKIDILNFLNQILQYMMDKKMEFLNYQNFIGCWKNNDIHFIHQCILEWESVDDYYNLLYGIILNQLINSYQFLEKVGLFYLLYSIYTTSDAKILISLDLEIMNQLYFFFQECQEKQYNDIFKLFMNLNNNKAIIISSRVGCKRLSIHPCGLPYIITKRNKTQLKEITEEHESEEEKNHRIELTKILLKNSEEYHKAKQKYNLSLNLTDPHFTQRCVHTLANIKQ